MVQYSIINRPAAVHILCTVISSTSTAGQLRLKLKGDGPLYPFSNALPIGQRLTNCRYRLIKIIVIISLVDFLHKLSFTAFCFLLPALALRRSGFGMFLV